MNKNFSDYCILILAGKVKLSDHNTKSHEYLFNVGNSLAFEKIKEKFSFKKEIKIYIAISKINKKLSKFLPFKNCQFIEVGETEYVMDSLSNAIDHIDENNINIIPITTIPEKKDLKINSCFFGIDKIPKENWSAIKFVDNNLKFLFKNQRNSYGLISHPFTGRFSAQKVHLKNVMKDIIREDRSDLLNLVKVLIEKYKYKVILEKWFDIGHEATYIKSKLSSISSRFFNNLVFDYKNNTIIKSSSNSEKISNEYFYYSKLPKRLRNYFPYIYSTYNLNQSIYSIEMEYIPYPNLAEIFLFKNIGPNGWIRIISSIKKIFDDFYFKEEYLLETNLSWLYSSKLSQRFEQTKIYINQSNNNKLKNILSNGLCINKNFYIDDLLTTYNNLNNYLLNYEKSVKQFIGHGDLCFNNILVDKLSGYIKLIDPKAFNNQKNNDIFGLMDPNYDLAKLVHSYKYLYDSIVNNIYSMDIRGNDVDLLIYAPYEYELVNKYFDDLIINKYIDKFTLKILTSSLFISMMPLHKDDENRMLCFAILGSIIFKGYEIKDFILKL